MTGGRRPNVLLIFADQQRWDTLGVNGSPMELMPNLDRLAREGTRFLLPITSQPVCAPARAYLLTGQYATTHGVWRNGLGLTGHERTLASSFGEAGYQTGYIGKWHLAPKECGPGPVPPVHRGGFAGLWEAANVLEFTSQPFETVLYDANDDEIRPPGYRVDAMTDRAIDFLRRARREPFFLMISYLEPHHQNDVDRYVAPEGYEARYANPFVPPDLRPLPGNWGAQLPGYYGCIKSLDENVGRLLATLEEQGLAEDTIVVYTADHGCHFRTRNQEYKRSAHDSSLRVPLVIWGPGFNRRQIVPEPVGLVDIAPTLLKVAGVAIPETMQGRSMLPLIAREAREWPEEVFVQISESMTGRALRTERWTYCSMSPERGARAAGSDVYVESHLYDNFADPHQHVNLVGRSQYKDVANHLRERLRARIIAAGEPEPVIRELGVNAPP
ncbi:MAG: sulfatase-like hydrolase/transferase [Chloroflexi bacterium]|nr:sulfatase-like hydrolase/transferase [Chloroflexota bacterium]